LGRYQSLQMSRGLHRTHVGTDGEYRQQIPFRDASDLGFGKRGWAEISREIGQMLDIDQDIQHTSLWHPAHHLRMQALRRLRNRPGVVFGQNRLPLFVDPDRRILWELKIHASC